MRKGWTKSLIALLICLLTLTMLLSACGGSSNPENPDAAPGETGAESPPEQSELFTEVGTYPIVKQPMTIRMFAPQFPTIEDMKTNAFTVFLEEKTNIKIDWDLVPNNALKDRKQLMLASGDYPEVILHGDLPKKNR